MDRVGEVRPEQERCSPTTPSEQVGHGTHRVKDGEAANMPLTWLDVAGVSGNMKDQG